MAIIPTKEFNLAAIDQAALQNATNFTQLKMATNKMNRDRQLGEIMRSSDDPRQVQENLRQQGYHDESLKMGKALDDAEKSQIANDLEMLKMLRKRAEVVNDEESYQQFKSIAEKNDPSGAALPGTYAEGKDMLDKFILGSKEYESLKQKDLDRESRESIAEENRLSKEFEGQLNRESREAIAEADRELRRELAENKLTDKMNKRLKDAFVSPFDNQEYSIGKLISLYKTDNKITDPIEMMILASIDRKKYEQELQRHLKIKPIRQWAKDKYGIEIYPGTPTGGHRKPPHSRKSIGSILNTPEVQEEIARQGGTLR